MELLQLAKICEITFSDTDLVLLIYNELLVLILPTFFIFFSVLSDALCSRQFFCKCKLCSLKNNYGLRKRSARNVTYFKVFA